MTYISLSPASFKFNIPSVMPVDSFVIKCAQLLAKLCNIYSSCGSCSRVDLDSGLNPRDLLKTILRIL